LKHTQNKRELKKPPFIKRVAVLRRSNGWKAAILITFKATLGARARKKRNGQVKKV